MTYLALLKAALAITEWLSKKAHDKQLIDAGQYKAIAEYNEKNFKLVSAAIDARRNVDHSPDSVQNDPNNRDNH